MAPARTRPSKALPRVGAFVEDCSVEFEPFSPERNRDKEAYAPQQVLVHVYELVAFETMNRVTAPLAFPIGGALHTGVEVYGREWSFGGGIGRGSGVVCEVPRTNRRHRFRETVLLGHTRLTSSEVALLIGDLVERWQAQEYHWIHRNCLAFANEFSELLGVGRLPPWIDRFARGVGSLDLGVRSLAHQAHGVVRTAQGVVELLVGGGADCGRCVADPGHTPSRPSARGQRVSRLSMHEVIVEPDGTEYFDWPAPKIEGFGNFGHGI